MSFNYPLHQRRKWQHDGSWRWDEHNSYSYWNITSSVSQTTCTERDGPLSSASSYISNNGTSPWALSPTSRHTDMLWLHTKCVLSSLCVLAIYIVENQICIVLRRVTHMFQHNSFVCNAFGLYLGGFAVIRFVVSAPGNLSRVWCQTTNRISPISGRICGLELLEDTDYHSITGNTTLQAAGRDYTQGRDTFYPPDDNGLSCLAVVFCGKEKGSVSWKHCDSFNLYPYGFFAIP